MTTESQIINSVIAGDAGAFRILVQRYQKPLFRFACNVIVDQHDAEDITQDVLLAAYNSLNSYDETKSSLLTWLFTICRNRCVNHMKKKRPIVDADGTIESRQTTSEKGESRSEFWQQLDAALARLPIQQKTVFVLAEIEELPYDQIAQIEQTTVGTVKSRIHRAKQRLKSCLSPTLGELK